MRPSIRQKKGERVFFQPLPSTHRSSFFSSLSPQEFVDLSNQMYIGILKTSFQYVNRAAPATRLVFYEDLVVVLGATFALLTIIITSLTSFAALDGVVTILIGLLMFVVAFRVGFDSMVGLIGVAAPHEVEEKVAKLILSDKDVTDINEIRIIQEGRYYHVESLIELRPGFSLTDADDIKFRVQDKLIADPDITDVMLGIIEDNGVKDWTPEKLNQVK